MRATIIESKTIDAAKTLKVGKAYSLNELCSILKLDSLKGRSHSYVLKKLCLIIDFDVIEHPHKKPKYTYVIKEIKNNNVNYHLSTYGKYTNDVTALFCRYLLKSLECGEQTLIMPFSEFADVMNLIPETVKLDKERIKDFTNISELKSFDVLKNFPVITRTDLDVFFSILQSKMTSVVSDCIKSIDKLDLYKRQSITYCYKNCKICKLTKDEAIAYKNIRRNITNNYGKTEYSINTVNPMSQMYRTEINKQMKQCYPAIHTVYTGHEFELNGANIKHICKQFTQPDDVYKKSVGKHCKEYLMKQYNNYYEQNKLLFGFSEMSVSGNFLSICAALLDFYYGL